MDEGLQHAGLALELIPKPKGKKGEDVEAQGGDPTPGHPKFGEYLDKKMLDFYAGRGKTLRAWGIQKGLTEAQFDSVKTPGENDSWTEDESKHRRDQQQLYLILYLEHLLYSTGLAISELIKFADRKVEDGTMTKKRLIGPGQKRLKKWIMGIGREDSSLDSHT